MYLVPKALVLVSLGQRPREEFTKNERSKRYDKHMQDISVVRNMNIYS